jgi:hypothetical protein
MRFGSWIGTICFLVTACGGTEAPEAAGGSGGSAGTPRAGSGGGGSGGASAGSGRGGTSGGSGGAGLAGAADCTAPWGPLTDVMVEPPPGRLASPGVSPDGRELFYIYWHTTDLPLGRIMRSVRTSTDDIFMPGEIVPELDAACLPTEDRSMEVSTDGLSAYILCFADLGSDSVGALHVAHRPSLGAAFVLDTMTYGLVGASPSFPADELTVFTSFEQGIGAGPLMTYERGAKSAAFGPGTPVPSLEDHYLASPTISSDALTLFATFSNSIVMSTRASRAEPFAYQDVAALPASSSDYFGAPFVSADCGSLYVVRFVVVAGEKVESIAVASH